MTAIQPEGFSLKETIIRIERKLDEFARDHEMRLRLLERDKQEKDKVASALLSLEEDAERHKESTFSHRDKVIIASISAIALLTNVLALGPDLIHSWF